MTESAALLVDEVLPREPLRQWVLSVPFPLRYLFATDPVAMGAVLGIVYRAIAAHLVGKAGLTQARARTGAVTLIQRFGSALNLNIHFHLLVLDGVYELTAAGPRFRRLPQPTLAELEALLGRIVTRIARHLERRGLVVRDAENGYLSAGPGEEDGLAAVVGHSITYRIAVGPNEGRKAFALQTLAPALTGPAGESRWRSTRASRCTLAWLLRLISATRSSGCATTLHGPRWPPGDSRSPRRAGALHAQDPVPRRHHARHR